MTDPTNDALLANEKPKLRILTNNTELAVMLNKADDLRDKDIIEVLISRLKANGSK